MTVLSVSVCEAYPRKEKESLFTEARGKGRWVKGGGQTQSRESETACACEGQKSIASIFLSGSLA